MHIGFKTFHPLRTAFFVCLVQIIMLYPALAADNIFKVNDVKVDITAKSAVKAREIAFERAQKIAFETLAQRMLSESEAAVYANQDIDTISALIQDYEIVNEQLSSVRYVATYNFRFKDTDVKNYFGSTGVQYTAQSSKTALVLPYYHVGSTTHLWSPYNVWMQAWSANDHMNGIVPMVVPMGDIQDVRDIREEDGLSYNDRRLESMLARYDAGEAIILMAVPDERLAAVKGPQDAAVGEMRIQIYRTDRGRPEYVQPITVAARNTDTLESFMEYAVGRVKRELRRNWKEKTVVQPGNNQSIVANVPIKSLAEWSQVQRALRSVYGLDSFKLQSLKPAMAVIALNFDGNFDRLQSAMVNANLVLQRDVAAASADPYSYFSSGRAAPVETYTLRLRGNHAASREMIFVPGQR